MHEIGQRAAVIETHARSISIKDANNVSVYSVEAVIGHNHGFRKSLGFIVHASRTDGVYVSPITLWLWTNLRIAIAL